jgi:hypothetical protein
MDLAFSLNLFMYNEFLNRASHTDEFSSIANESISSVVPIPGFTPTHRWTFMTSSARSAHYFEVQLDNRNLRFAVQQHIPYSKSIVRDIDMRLSIKDNLLRAMAALKKMK